MRNISLHLPTFNPTQRKAFQLKCHAINYPRSKAFLLHEGSLCMRLEFIVEGMHISSNRVLEVHLSTILSRAYCIKGLLF